MGLFGARAEFRRGGSWRGVGCVGLVLVALGGSASGLGGKPKVVLTPWERAVRARAGFEAELAETHTKASRTRAVMDEFRAIYHDAPERRACGGGGRRRRWAA